MTRQEKYPDTATFHNYNANPKNKITDDCTVRAIATALKQDYKQTYKEMFELSLKCGYFVNDTKCYTKYLASKGWLKRKQPRKPDGTKYTGEEFCKEYRPTCIAHIGGHHIVAIVNGRVWDTWNSTDGCIGNFWTEDKYDRIY